MKLCPGHYQQRVRGLQLTPLRPRPAEPLVTLGLRVPQFVRAAASADPAGARAALAAWVVARDARHSLAPVSRGVLVPANAQHPLANVNASEPGRKPAGRQMVQVGSDAPAQKKRTRRWRCTRCQAVYRLPWVLAPGTACEARTARSSAPCGGGLVPAGR
jgi:hypothetical protein